MKSFLLCALVFVMAAVCFVAGGFYQYNLGPKPQPVPTIRYAPSPVPTWYYPALAASQNSL